MNVLKILENPAFSFQYNGNPFDTVQCKVSKENTLGGDGKVNEYRITYLLPDGLEIIQSLKEYPEFDACEWVLQLWNHSSERSGLISDLNDCDINLEFAYDAMPKQGYLVPDSVTRIHRLLGSNFSPIDFSLKEHSIIPGQKRKYATWGGLSSSWGPISQQTGEPQIIYSPDGEEIHNSAPFFDLNHGEHGVICAIGWTGQWNASFTRNEKGIQVQTGIEDLCFRLLPGEKIRTSSILLMEYRNGQNNGHNSFRRLVKEHFSLIGKPGREQNGPLSTLNWGSVPSQQMLERIDTLAKNEMGFEYFWIDAAWYGNCTCKDEYDRDWDKQTGNWYVSENTHPDGLLDVARAVKDNGMKFLLWFEPERVYHTTRTAQEHPEWFFRKQEDSPGSDYCVLNLGNPEALNDTINMVSDYIEKLGLDCYRQDYCWDDPVEYWRLNDEPGRKGMNEIKHIMGLYEFWDTLLTRFPHLLIDNCASGGRRIDIEMAKRSIPLFRSDYQCVWDYDPESSQNHNSGISWFLPYSGTSAGGNCGIGDIYRYRSAYSAALTSNFWGYPYWNIEDKEVEWVKKANEEYKRARPYFSCDYYPLLAPVSDNSNWCAWQYDRPEQSDGIVLAFRRPDSPFETSSFALSHVKSGMMYRFEDADTGEITEISSDTLLKNGLTINLPEKRSSKLLYGKRGF